MTATLQYLTKVRDAASACEDNKVNLGPNRSVQQEQHHHPNALHLLYLIRYPILPRPEKHLRWL